MNIIRAKACLLLLSIHLLVFAEAEQLAQAPSTQKLLVVTENWRPYNYLEKGEIKGVSTAIVKRVLEKAGIAYDLVVYPWARGYKLAQSQKNVLIYTIIRKPSREHLFKWVKPLGKGGTTFLYRLKKNHHLNLDSLVKARQYQIVTSVDSIDHLWLREHGFTRLQAPGSMEQMIRMFYKERADLIAIEGTSMEAEFSHYGFDPNDVEPVIPLFSTPPYMALSLTTSDAMLKKIQRAYDLLLHEQKITLVN